MPCFPLASSGFRSDWPPRAFSRGSGCPIVSTLYGIFIRALLIHSETSDAQRVETHLRVGGCHGCFERGCSVDGLRRGLLPCLSPADRPVALDDAQPFRVVDAGDQIDDIHLGVVQAAQDGAHLGQRSLVAARIQGNGGQVHQAHGAVLVVGLPAFAFDDLEPQVIQLGFAGRIDQPVGGYFQIIRDIQARTLEAPAAGAAG